MKNNIINLTLFMLMLAASSESFCAAAAPAPKHRKAKTVLVQPSPIQQLKANATLKIFARLLPISEHAENDDVFDLAVEQYFNRIDNSQGQADNDEITRSKYITLYTKLMSDGSKQVGENVSKYAELQWDEIKKGALDDILHDRSVKKRTLSKTVPQKIKKNKSACTIM